MKFYKYQQLLFQCLLLIAFIGTVSAQKFSPKYLRENDKKLLQFVTEATADGWLEFKRDAEGIKAATFASQFAGSIGIQEGYQLRLVRDKVDVKETRHQHYQLYANDVLIEDGHLDLHSRQGVLVAAHSRIIENVVPKIIKPIDKVIALTAALLDRKLTKELLRNKQLPDGQLVLTHMTGDYNVENYKLAYKFDTYGEKPMDAFRIYVDASSGLVIKRVPLFESCLNPRHEHSTDLHSPVEVKEVVSKNGFAPLTTATFNSIHPRSNPMPSFEVEPFNSGYRLTMSTNIGQALQTRNDVNGNFQFDDPDVTNPSTNWGNNAQNATLAHWTVWRTHQYFQNRFGLNGTDGQGTVARILISPGLTDNATWITDQRLMILGSHNGNVLSGVDIVAHEYGHGVSSHLVAGWTRGQGTETGALNEGFSDIIGTAMERELYPSGGPNDVWNFRIGEDAWFLRDMQNPHNSPIDFTGTGQPEIYQEQGFWDFNTQEIHHNASVLNKWFHTLVTGQGPRGVGISPISFEDAMSIVYWGLDNYIYGDYGYYDAAQALRVAAGALYGQCSPQQIAVARAWGAVGIQMGSCTPDCNFQAVNITPTNVACNQAITLNTSCGARSNDNYNSYTCQNVTYSYAGPNVPYNSSTNSSLNITAPSSSGVYQYSVTMSKPNSGCYNLTTTFNVAVNCSNPGNCDFSNGPRYVGTWNGLIVQIRQISGKNVLVTAIPNSSTDKYYPRGDNFWQYATIDPGAANLQSCLNAGYSGYNGFSPPDNIYPPSGYYQGNEQDGALYFAQNGTNPPNPCDVSPRHVGTWNGLNVEIRTFPNGKHALVTAVAGSSNDKYYPRGDNFWDNFTKDAGADQYQSCLNAGQTGFYGLNFPNGVIYPPAGYQQGTSQDGAVYFSTNGARVAATETLEEKVSIVKIHPNPAQEEVVVTVALDKPLNVPIRLIDMQGKTLQQHILSGIAGKNEKTLQIGSMQSGIYIIEVVVGNDRIMHKLLKQ